MLEKENNTKKFINVDMDEVQISTDEKPIIGTEALATCVGVLLYSEKHKKAIVAHASSDIDYILSSSINLIDESGIGDSEIKYKVISGYYYNHYAIKTKLENFYKAYPEIFIPFDENKIPNNSIETLEELNSRRFAFDSSTGMFVTDKVLFGEEYLKINQKRTK